MADTATRIDATDRPQPWRAADIRAHIRAARAGTVRRRRRLLNLIPFLLLLPSVLFLGVGSFKSTAELQEYFTTCTGPKLLLACAAAALAWTAWLLTMLLRTWREAAAQPLAEPLATHRFRFSSAVASATTGTLLLWRSAGPAGPDGRVIPTTHLLEALDHFLAYLGFALLLLSLLAPFPPGAGLALAGSGAVGGLTPEGVLVAARLGIAGIALMAAGGAGGGVPGENGGSEEGERGKSRDDSIDETEKVFSPKERSEVKPVDAEFVDYAANLGHAAVEVELTHEYEEDHGMPFERYDSLLTVRDLDSNPERQEATARQIFERLSALGRYDLILVRDLQELLASSRPSSE
ncbi:hypothetical protein ACFYO2_10635 [Streptomyces sp. NPDC006602]|uniref:hypothetical protein n=1 Tax=Streptomyces sp. NPDC006602 TaxID=3364751 RepID=UPI0036BD2F66